MQQGENEKVKLESSSWAYTHNGPGRLPGWGVNMDLKMLLPAGILPQGESFLEKGVAFMGIVKYDHYMIIL